jgi:glycosyltransferase involved in cell wall biosynthesis
MNKSIKKNKKFNIAFIKRLGILAGGTERWLQFVAITLIKNGHNVDYYYSQEKEMQDKARLKELKKKINLIPFQVKKIANTPKREWIVTDFWEKFNECNYDFICTAMYCNTEYPFYKIKKPIIALLPFGTEIDLTKNVLHSVFPSEWIRQKWIMNGGSKIKSSVIPIPVQKPFNKNNFRKVLKMKKSDIIAGFHQRVDNDTYSNIPLDAFKNLDGGNFYFIIMGGSDRYKEQAKKLKLKNIIFLPHDSRHSTISKFLNTLNIFAHGRADGETYGTVFAEALAHKLPCLSHYSGIDDAHKLTMGSFGIFAQDSEEYNRLLKKFFNDGSFRKNLSLGADIFAIKNYGTENTKKKVIKLFNEIMININKDDTGKRLFLVFNVFLIRSIKFLFLQFSRLIPSKNIKKKFQNYIIHRANFRFVSSSLY